MKIILLFLFITAGIFGENVFDNTEDIRKYIEKKFVKKYPRRLFDTTKDFEECAVLHYIADINKEDYEKKLHEIVDRADFILEDKITVYYKKGNVEWSNIRKNKIYRRDGTWFYHRQVYEWVYKDPTYDDYRKSKKGFKIFGSYYMFNEADYEALFDKEYINNKFECIVFTINVKNDVQRNEFEDMVKTKIDEDGHIVIDFYKLDQFYNKVDEEGKKIFSVIIVR